MKKSILLSFVLMSFLLPMSIFSNGVVVGNLKGQLGNQMFQIAAAIAHARNHHAYYYFPDLIEKNEYGIPENYREVFFRITNLKPPVTPSYTYNQKDFRFNSIPYHSPMIIDGYFQSEKFFDGHQDVILPLFEPSGKIKKYLHQKFSDIIAHPNSVAIHIRTYFKEDPKHMVYSFNGRDYVERAMQCFPEDALFVVFSDNIEWCKKELNGLRPNIRFIEGEKYIHDFFLISYCKHQIISNSSFSWWAAYLNKNPNKIVIAPKRWFEPNYISDTEDIIPHSWILID